MPRSAQLMLAATSAAGLVTSVVVGGAPPAKAIAVTGSPTPGSGGANVTGLNSPFMTLDGRAAFTGAIDNGLGGNMNFVWFDGAIVWLNSDALPIVLTTAESTMGIGSAGEWVYSPTQDGLDAVWSNGASLLKDSDPAPGFDGQFISFCSRPQMNADGTPTWISGVTDTIGGGTLFRVLYVDGVPALAAGDVVDGQTIAGAGGIGFAYDFSSDGVNLIVRCTIDAPATSSDVIIVGDTIVAREGDPTGDGDNWQNFGDTKVNNANAHVFSGDTNAAGATDGFLVHNGQIVVREGDTLLGTYTLTGNPSVVGLNDLGQYGAIWGSDKGEILFVYTPTLLDGGFLLLDVLLAVGDPVDLDGDDVPDGTVSDFNAASIVGPGLDLPRQCRACVNVDVAIVGGATVEANVCVALPPAAGLVDLDGGGSVDGGDLGILLSQWGGPGIADFNCDGIVDGADLGIMLGAWS